MLASIDRLQGRSAASCAHEAALCSVLQARVTPKAFIPYEMLKCTCMAGLTHPPAAACALIYTAGECGGGGGVIRQVCKSLACCVRGRERWTGGLRTKGMHVCMYGATQNFQVTRLNWILQRVCMVSQPPQDHSSSFWGGSSSCLCSWDASCNSFSHC